MGCGSASSAATTPPPNSALNRLLGDDVRLRSAAGVTELVDLHDRLSRAAAHLAIAAAPRHVRKVPTITGLDDIVILADTVDDATRLTSNTRSASRHFVWRPRPGHRCSPLPPSEVVIAAIGPDDPRARPP